MHVVATAGHVDHGKSTLVRALTGMDPDRLAEEKARGLTIDLGFAHTVLPSGREIDFVDVPGHVRFIRNMLAGVGAVDSCLFVVDAKEGWKPQSEEHLRVMDLLGVSSGVIALTKIGLTDDDEQQLARLAVIEHVAGTFLEGAEVVAVDAVTGSGLDVLQATFDRVLEVTPTAADRHRPRLWVDRRFATSGAGTVVTGTLAGGSIETGDELLVVGPGQADGRKVRVRGVQTHGQVQTSVCPGRRVALNLVGVAPREMSRGTALVLPGQWHATAVVDASLEVLESVGHVVSRRGAFKMYIGSGEHAVKMQTIGGHGIPSGGQGMVRLWLPVAVPLLPGDRYVLRESGRSETVGGGEILDVAPVLPASRARPSRSVERVVSEREWVDVDDLYRMTGERLPPSVGRWVVHPPTLDLLRTDLVARVEGAGPLGWDLAGADDKERAVLRDTDGIIVRSGRAFPASAPEGVPTELADHAWLVALEERPWSPPAPLECGAEPAVVSEMVRFGLVISRDGIHFAPRAVEDAARVVAQLLASTTEGITVAQVRNALGTTRRFAVPLLAELDATGVTRRRGDLRFGGPKLPVL